MSNNNVKFFNLISALSGIAALIIIGTFISEKVLRRKLKITNCDIVKRSGINTEEVKFSVKNRSNYLIRLLEIGQITKKTNKQVSYIFFQGVGWYDIQPKSFCSVECNGQSGFLTANINQISRIYIKHNTDKDYKYRKKRMLKKACKDSITTP
ncbi:hypothetical protein KA005_38175 [bacterium]|nr:hypothetical protein [bacterium]